MIKTFEPFQSKIQLHIETGFLQRLWDRYVPVSSDSYDRISLIYLKGNHKAEEEPERQIQLIVNMILKNTLLQMNLKENQMLLTQNMVSRSLAFSTRLYLEQLKRADINIYHSLKRHIVYMEGKAEEDRRYRSWQRENQTVKRMMKVYQILSDFSKRLTEFKTVQFVKIEKRYAKELISSLKKDKEFQVLLKNMKDKEFQSLLRNTREEEFQILLENMKEEEIHYLCERLPGILVRESRMQEDFREEKQTVPQKLKHRFRYNTYRKLNARLSQIQENYLKEVITCLKESIFKEAHPEEYRVIADTVNVDSVLDKLSQEHLPESRILMKDIQEMEIETAKLLTEQKQEIIKTERVLYEKYQDVFRSERFKSIFGLQENRVSRIHNEKQKFEKLWKWTGALFDLEERVFRTVEDEAELRTLTKQLAGYLEKKVSFEEIKMTGFSEYQEEQPDNLSIQELIEYIHGIKSEKEYKSFVRRLADTVAVRYEMEQEDISYETQMYEGQDTETAEKPALKLWKWSEALLLHPKQKEDGGYPDTFPAEESGEGLWRYEEDAQTLKQLIEDMKANRILTYREEQLSDLSIQELLGYIRQIKDEKEYKRFVGRLEDTVLTRYRMSQEDGEKLWEWSRALLIHLSEAIETGSILAERERMRHSAFIQELLEYIHEIDTVEEYEGFIRRLADTAVLRYRMEQEEIPAGKQPFDSSIRELLAYIGQIDNEKEYEEFIRELTDTVMIRYRTEQEEFFKEVQKYSGESDEKLWEWGKALLLYPKQNRDTEEPDSLSANRTEERTLLKHLTVQLSDYIEEKEASLKTGRSFVYREEQLFDPSIRELLQYIRQIDDESEYQRFVARLADTVVARFQAEQESAFEDFVKVQEKNIEKVYSQNLFESYPKLMYEMQKHERQKSRDYKPENSRIGQLLGLSEEQKPYSSQVQADARKSYGSQVQADAQKPYGNLAQQDIRKLYDNPIQPNARKYYDNPIQPDAGKLYGSQILQEHIDLKHALLEKGLGDSQRADRIHMQDESVQMKSLQKQLDVRLSEVEQKLSEAESREKAQLNVRDITEKVKRQLHEELHIERMRRGMS